MLMYRERSEREAELRALVQGKMKERMVALESQLTEYEALVSGGAVQTVVIPPPAPALPEALGATARTASAKNEDGELRDSSQTGLLSMIRSGVQLRPVPAEEVRENKAFTDFEVGGGLWQSLRDTVQMALEIRTKGIQGQDEECDWS